MIRVSEPARRAARRRRTPTSTMDRRTFEALAPHWQPGTSLEAVSATLSASIGAPEISSLVWVGLVFLNVALVGLLGAIASAANLDEKGYTLFGRSAT